MKLGFTTAPGRGDADLVLAGLASALAARGMRCSGIVQINTERPDAGPCDMDVRVLPDGPVLRISQDLGPNARGCRLNPAALEAAVARVGVSLSGQTDLLIVNKFGKHEAEGRGFRSVIADALAMGIPVLVGVNGLNKAAFETFASGCAVPLPCRHDRLLDWALSAIGVRA